MGMIPAEAVEEAHVTDGGSCWCRPTVDFDVDGGHIVIHNKEAQ